MSHEQLATCSSSLNHKEVKVFEYMYRISGKTYFVFRTFFQTSDFRIQTLVFILPAPGPTKLIALYTLYTCCTNVLPAGKQTADS